MRPGVREILAYRGGYMAVPAVPGAGKTTTLACLAAELIAAGTGGRVLIVTYMHAAVGNFKQKLARFLEEKGLPPTRGYEVKTLHGLAVTVLRERPDRLLIDEALRVLDPAERERILRAETRRWIGENYEVWQGAVRSHAGESVVRRRDKLKKWERRTVELMGQLISHFKCRGLTVERLEPLLPQLAEASFLRWAIEVFRRYQWRLATLARQDFDDLILNALTLLEEDAGVRERLQKRWPYIFEDEAQDSNPLQEKMLFLLAGEKGNLVRVGDANQAIMGTFTVAEPELFRSFCRREGVVVSPLLSSSRSSRDIIELANLLVDWVRAEHPTPACRTALEGQHIAPVPPGDRFPNPVPPRYTIVFREYRTGDEELRHVVREACRYTRENPTKTAAILVPDRYVMADAMALLDKMGAVYREVAGGPAERRRTVQTLGAVLDYLAYPHRADKLVRALQRTVWPEIDEEEFAPFRELLVSQPLEQLLYPLAGSLDWARLPREITEHPFWENFARHLAEVRRWLDAARMPPESLILFLAEELGLAEEELAIAQRVALAVRDLVRENPSWRLPDLAEQLLLTETMFDYFTQVVYERKGFSPEPGVISLSTYHRAKGLEWDTVFVVGVTDDRFPSLLTDSFRDELWFLRPELANPGALARAELRTLLGEGSGDPVRDARIEVIGERLRLLYVAVTRAKENLMVTAHREKVLPSGGTSRVRPAVPFRRLAAHAGSRAGENKRFGEGS
ncbi:MAG: ATP-dependent helicase [Bacillota bacterium]